MFGIQRGGVKPPPCLVDKLAGGSLTGKLKISFAVSWPRKLGKERHNYIIAIFSGILEYRR